MKPYVVAALCLCLLPNAVSAIDPPIRADSTVDWISGRLVVSITVSLADLATPTEARSKAVDLFERKIGAIFCDVLYEMILDSHRTVGEAFEDDPETLARLVAIGGNTNPSSIHMNTELESITALYEYHFYPDIMSVFTVHTHAYEPVEILKFVPNVEYSGIVIYVGGSYPIHGEPPAPENVVGFVPSLRPRIYDTNMRLVAEAEMVDPEALNSWGLAAFTDRADYLVHKFRVGPTPLLTMAREVFGDHRTDIIIPASAADRLLASRHNRELIRQGRILVIFED